MKLSKVVLGQCLWYGDEDGTLYFIPERIEEHVIYGYSMYTPVTYDASTGRLEDRTVLYIYSIPAIYDGRHNNRMLMLKNYEVLSQEISIQRLIRWIFELKVTARK